MKCPKCGSNLVTTGTGRAIQGEPEVKLSYWCQNKGCEYFQKSGKVIGDKFRLEETSESK